MSAESHESAVVIARSQEYFGLLRQTDELLSGSDMLTASRLAHQVAGALALRDDHGRPMVTEAGWYRIDPNYLPLTPREAAAVDAAATTARPSNWDVDGHA